jgi:hypothetical protein
LNRNQTSVQDGIEIGGIFLLQGPPLRGADQEMDGSNSGDEDEAVAATALASVKGPPMRCQKACDCCSPHGHVIPLPASFRNVVYNNDLSVNFETALIDSMSIETTPKRPPPLL